MSKRKLHSEEGSAVLWGRAVADYPFFSASDGSTVAVFSHRKYAKELANTFTHAECVRVRIQELPPKRRKSK